MRTWMRSKATLLFLTCAVLLAGTAVAAFADQLLADADSLATGTGSSANTFSGTQQPGTTATYDFSAAINNNGSSSNDVFTGARSDKVTVTNTFGGGSWLDAAGSGPSSFTFSSYDTNQAGNISVKVPCNAAANTQQTLTVTLNASASNGQTLTGDPQTLSYTITAQGSPAASCTPVNTAPQASGQSVTTNEDTAKQITLTGTDADGDNLSFSVASGPTKGTLGPIGTPTCTGTTTKTCSANVTYTPNADYNGADSFTFKANDGKVDSSAATVNIAVSPVNDAPKAVDDAKTTNEDTTLTFQASTLLANDSDVDGDTLSVTSVGSAAHGTVNLSGGTVTYAPNADYNGPDSFTYTVSDGKGGTATAKVNVTVSPVNDKPVAKNDTYTTSEDQNLSIAAGTGVLSNDSDADGDTLSAALVSGPAHGTLILNNDGSFTYNPASNFNGTDSFTYKASDGTLGSDTATVSITVTPVNDKPVAKAGSVTTDEDTTSQPFTLDASDVDGDSLTYVIVNGPSHGTLGGSGNTRTYTPDADYNGADSFTFKANDGTDDSNVATVSIAVTPVNDKPVAGNDTKTTNEDTPLVFQASDLLNNDSAGPANESGQTLTVTAVGNAANGTVSLSGGTITFTPDPNFYGQAHFYYTVCDNGSPQLCSVNEAIVDVTVNSVNDAPVASNNAYSVDEDNTLTVAAPGVLGNDTDVENDPLTAVKVSGPAHGSVTLNANGSFTYTPDANYNGSDSFTYKANDGTDDSNIATVTITVNAVNDAPAIGGTNGLTTVPEDKSGNQLYSVSASDVDGDTLGYKWTVVSGNAQIVGSDTGSNVSVNFPDGPANVALKVEVSDGNGGADSRTINVTVNNVKPTLSALTLTGNSGTACAGATNNVRLQFSFSDPAGSNDTYTGSINWGDTQSDSFSGSPVDKTHAYSAGTYTINVSVNDEDPGTGDTKSASNAVSQLYNMSVIQAPINSDGTSVFKSGSTIPVKVKITDCLGNPVSGLAPTVKTQLANSTTPTDGINEPISTSAADTTGVMRYDLSAGQYIYNMASKSVGTDQDAKYRVLVQDAKSQFSATQVYAAQVFGLRTK